MEEIAPYIFSWSAPHPEYRPRAEEVVSYALVAGEALLLVDPLLPGDEGRAATLLAALDDLAGAARRLDLYITIPYHTRSAEALLERYAPALPALLWGHRNVRKRLSAATPFEEIPQVAAGEAVEVAGGVAAAYTIGRPRRSEHPLHVPSLRAAAFGDAVVGVRGGVRFWNQSAGTGAGWYRDVFAPTLAPLAAQDVEYVLVTHGRPVLRGGRRALEECLAAPPVDTY